MIHILRKSIFYWTMTIKQNNDYTWWYSNYLCTNQKIFRCVAFYYYMLLDFCICASLHFSKIDNTFVEVFIFYNWLQICWCLHSPQCIFMCVCVCILIDNYIHVFYWCLYFPSLNVYLLVSSFSTFSLLLCFMFTVGAWCTSSQ